MLRANNERTQRMQELFFFQTSFLPYNAPPASTLLRLSNSMKRCDTLIGSASVTFPLLALRPPPPGTSGAGWHPSATGPSGCRVTPAAKGPRLTCFNNFLPSSVKLCKYFSPVSSSLERQLRVSVGVFFSFFFFLVTAVEQARRRSWPALELKVSHHSDVGGEVADTRCAHGEALEEWNNEEVPWK